MTEVIHRLLWCIVAGLLFVALAAMHSITRKD